MSTTPNPRGQMLFRQWLDTNCERTGPPGSTDELVGSIARLMRALGDWEPQHREQREAMRIALDAYAAETGAR